MISLSPMGICCRLVHSLHREKIPCKRRHISGCAAGVFTAIIFIYHSPNFPGKNLLTWQRLEIELHGSLTKLCLSTSALTLASYVIVMRCKAGFVCLITCFKFLSRLTIKYAANSMHSGLVTVKRIFMI